MAKDGHEPDVTIKIPRPLYLRLKQVIEDSGFHSVTEFIVYVMRDLASNRERFESIEAPSATSEPEALTPAEIEAVRKRLESLGYL
jgi:hypothetical protein